MLKDHRKKKSQANIWVKRNHIILLEDHGIHKNQQKNHLEYLAFPPAAVTAAAKGRIAVPAFPRKS